MDVDVDIDTVDMDMVDMDMMNMDVVDMDMVDISNSRTFLSPFGLVKTMPFLYMYNVHCMDL